MRRALIVSGTLLAGYAVIGAAVDDQVNRVGVLVFLLALVVLHDAVLLPLVLAAGALIRRVVPTAWQGTVRITAIVCLAVTVVGLPLALGFGRSADNPTVLPHPYPRNLILILGVVVVTAVVGRKGIERWRNHRGRRRVGSLPP